MIFTSLFINQSVILCTLHVVIIVVHCSDLKYITDTPILITCVIVQKCTTFTLFTSDNCFKTLIHREGFVHCSFKLLFVYFEYRQKNQTVFT